MVETEIKKCEVEEIEEVVRETAGEVVVAEIELVEEIEVFERGRGAGEVVRVGVEDGEVWELIDKALDCRSAEMIAVEVDGGDGGCVLAVWWCFTVEALVLADFVSMPRICDF